MTDDKIIIALVGRKRSGKDTAGEFLRNTYQFSPARKLAQPIKQIGMMLFGWTEDMVEGNGYDREQFIPELGLSVRQFLQECGSIFKYNLSEILPEYGKQVGTRVWVKACVNWLDARDPGFYYLTDVRFPEEVDELKSAYPSTYVVKLVSDRSPQDTHISETSVDMVEADYTVVNDGYDSYGILYCGLEAVVDDIMCKRYDKYHV